MLKKIHFLKFLPLKYDNMAMLIENYQKKKQFNLINQKLKNA
jgi:hypothetical protein